MQNLRNRRGKNRGVKKRIFFHGEGGICSRDRGVGLRKEHAAKLYRRAGYADLRDNPGGRPGSVWNEGGGADDFQAAQYRIYLPVLSAGGGAERGAEHQLSAAFGLPEAGAGRDR